MTAYNSSALYDSTTPYDGAIEYPNSGRRAIDRQRNRDMESLSIRTIESLRGRDIEPMRKRDTVDDGRRRTIE